MTSSRKPIVAALLGLALAGALSAGVTELYASAVLAEASQSGQSICPLKEKAADDCPLDETPLCPNKTKGA